MAGMETDGHGLEVLDRGTCLALLTRAHVGRLGLSVDALPVVLPVNFTVDGEEVIVASGPGGKLSAAMEGNVVAFEVDEWDPLTHCGWSVLVRGHSRVLDADEEDRVRDLPLRPWGQLGDVSHLAVRLDLVTGRRLRPAGAPRWPGADRSTPTGRDGPDRNGSGRAGSDGNGAGRLSAAGRADRQAGARTR
jgi:hypothetical protein